MTGAGIKALPLWQPWATLVAIGAKRVETRAYPPGRLGLHEGQRIAIHACKRPNELWLCDEHPFAEYDLDAGQLPLGAIVATATIDRAWEMTETLINELEHVNPHEHAFGLYRPGRWAWVLIDVEQLPAPVSIRGGQGTFDVPLEAIQ